MNFKNTIRVHAMLLGLAGTLLLGNVAKAQQEMDPTPFDDGQFVTTMVQPIPATAEALTLASGTIIETKNQPVPMAVKGTEALMVSNVDTSEWTTLAGWAVLALVIAMALFLRRKISPVKPAARQKMNNELTNAKIHAL
jgi:hypothetical protein